MSRRLWVAMVDTDLAYKADRNWESKYNPEEQYMGVFTSERYAKEWAMSTAKRFGGCDVHVFKQDYGFISQPRPVEKKVWNASNEFLPAP